jgi:phospholipid/cholesterol/gamma-HCH transport system substrate-binding protein
MEKSASYFMVGVFVSLVIFFFTGFLIWLAGPHDKQDLTFYTVEFTDSISGLEEGSDVQYRGVKIGKVMKMHLVPDNNSLVHVDIGVDKQVPIRAHTKIALQTQGITGLVRMEMSTENDDLEPPEQRADMQYPVLYGQGPQLYKILEDIPVITAQTADITKKLNGILTRNRGNIDHFASRGLSQFTAAAQELKGTAASVRKLSEKLSDNPSQIIYQPATHGVEIPR